MATHGFENIVCLDEARWRLLAALGQAGEAPRAALQAAWGRPLRQTQRALNALRRLGLVSLGAAGSQSAWSITASGREALARRDGAFGDVPERPVANP